MAEAYWTAYSVVGAGFLTTDLVERIEGETAIGSV